MNFVLSKSRPGKAHSDSVIVWLNVKFYKQILYIKSAIFCRFLLCCLKSVTVYFNIKFYWKLINVAIKVNKLFVHIFSFLTRFSLAYFQISQSSSGNRRIMVCFFHQLLNRNISYKNSTTSTRNQWSNLNWVLRVSKLRALTVGLQKQYNSTLLTEAVAKRCSSKKLL